MGLRSRTLTFTELEASIFDLEQATRPWNIQLEVASTRAIDSAPIELDISPPLRVMPSELPSEGSGISEALGSAPRIRDWRPRRAGGCPQ